jgi:hypothetical protein
MRTPIPLATMTPSVANSSIPSRIHPTIELRTATPTFPIEIQTVSAHRTRFAATPTSEPTWTSHPIPPPTPTCEPMSESATPVATLLARPNKNITDTIAALALQTYMTKFQPGDVPAVFVEEDHEFDIEIVDGSIDPNWATTSPAMNGDNTLGVFFSYDPRPTPEDDSEWYIWAKSKKMLIEDYESRKIYWVKWEDIIPWRPIDIEGWATKDIFVFSQFGNPSYGFLVAIDARAKKVLHEWLVTFWC